MRFAAKWMMWWTDATKSGWRGLKLAWWRSEVERLYAGAPEHPVGQALLPHVRALDLPQGQLLEIIDGMEMDLTRRATPVS